MERLINTLKIAITNDVEDEIDYDDLDEFEDDSAQTNYQEVNALDSKKGIKSYELVNPQKLEEGEIPLGKVIGHEQQKKELLLVIDWFKRSISLKEKGVSIPKGVILFGQPGNGKSLLIKEIIKCCDAPVFVFQGEQINIVEGVIETFKKAREAGHAIIVFDELDLLINKDRRVIRALQENLDGVESSDDILVLAATNSIREIPGPLLRHGRLEKLIEIPDPTGEEALELLKKHLKEFNIKIPSDFDDEEVALALNGISCAGVKSVVNDLVLRNGFENITLEMIYNSIYNITDRIINAPEVDNFDTAIHEAGHAVMTKSFPEYFIVNRLNISGGDGEFYVKEVDRCVWPYDKVIADIKISMAGVIAQKIICGKGSRGCESDLQRARKLAYNIINMCGYSSCWETLPPIKNSSRMETSIKRRRMERKIESLLRKCEKDVTKYIKSHKKEVIALGKLLFEKKRLKSSEILSCIG